MRHHPATAARDVRFGRVASVGRLAGLMVAVLVVATILSLIHI